ncbi:MAG: heavy metal resistance protein CzcA [Nitrososphaerota archaeon]|jgi:DNA excision repair protein ERCC-4|nr:heavy metal resistance protein CzcA [Nitrososphaerota archaeon]
MIPSRVVVDERERQSGVPEALSKLNIRVYYSNLRTADYVISPEIAVERKALRDFVSSVYDGRLFVQASEISSAYRKPYLVIEGDIKELAQLTSNLNSYYGAVASVTLAYDLRVMHTADRGQTAAAIAALAQQSRARPLPPGSFSGPPKANDEPRQQLYLVSALPGVGTKLARRLLSRYGTPRKIMNLTESQLAMVQGLGPKRASKIARTLDVVHATHGGAGQQQEKLLE